MARMMHKSQKIGDRRPPKLPKIIIFDPLTIEIPTIVSKQCIAQVFVPRVKIWCDSEQYRARGAGQNETIFGNFGVLVKIVRCGGPLGGSIKN